jgi:hypothetical protein
MSKNTKIVIVVSVAVLIIGVLIYLYIRSINKARLGKKDDAPAPTPTPTPPAQRTVGNPATCSWLNGTYPKLKTNEFNDIDGGAHNPQAQVDWKANNCDLMYH